MLNHIVVMGRLVKDPELRRTNDGKAVTSFSIACERDFKTAGADVDFFNCVAFGKTAEFLHSYFFKGSKLVLLGRLQNRSWIKDGVKKTVTEILADKVYFGESKQAERETKETGDFAVLEDMDEDLPV